jgi:hypothetical protein
MKVIGGLLALTFVANAVFGSFSLYPVESIVSRYMTPSVRSAYGNLCGSLFLTVGVVFLAVLLHRSWESRKDLRRLIVSAGLLSVAASPMFDTHLYSSRYTEMSLPCLLLAAQPLRQWRIATLLTALLGCGVGFLSLSGYFPR